MRSPFGCSQLKHRSPSLLIFWNLVSDFDIWKTLHNNVQLSWCCMVWNIQKSPQRYSCWTHVECLAVLLHRGTHVECLAVLEYWPVYYKDQPFIRQSVFCCVSWSGQRWEGTSNEEWHRCFSLFVCNIIIWPWKSWRFLNKAARSLDHSYCHHGNHADHLLPRVPIVSTEVWGHDIDRSNEKVRLKELALRLHDESGNQWHVLGRSTKCREGTTITP